MPRPFVRPFLMPAAIMSLVFAAACADASPPARDTAAAAGRPVSPAVAATDTAGHASGVSVPARDSARVPAPREGKGIAPAASAASAAPPRRIVFGDIDFTDVGHDRGQRNAPVVVIDLSDFACPYCGEFSRDVFPAIDHEYVQTGKVLFKYIPFIAGPFPHAAEATRAAECVAEQGQFWTMVDHLYATQAEWKRGRAVDAQMAALAGTLPVDTARFARCYADRHTDALTARATAVANDLGVRVTPSFLVDGNPVQGALPLAEFRKQIETALLLKSSKTHPSPKVKS